MERRHAALCASLPSRLRVHDVRERSLATTLGDVPFRWRRLRGRDGETVIPLVDELDLPWGARVSPAAEKFLVEAGPRCPAPPRPGCSLAPATRASAPRR